MEEEKLTEEKQEELINEQKKLMRKSLRMIISFFTLTVTCAILLVLLQDNKFFIFNIHRSFDNVPNPLITQMFSIFFIVIIAVGLISYLSMLVAYLKRRNMSFDEKVDSLSKYKRIYNLSDIFSVVPIFLVIVMIVNGFFFSFAQVDGPSMMPTFCDNDAVIIKYVDEYEAQDIIIFQVEENDGSVIYLIKRLIAIPGDKLVVNSTGVWVNDVLIEDNIVSGTVSYNVETIPDGYYYVLGDNRNNSSDSRTRGLISYEDLIGRVVLKVSSNTCN